MSLKPYLMDNYIYSFINKYISPNLCFKFLKPDYITMIRIIPICFIYKAIIYKQKTLLFFSIMISAILDLFDGSVARECDKRSKFGSVIDGFVDYLHYTIIIYYIIILYVPSIQYKGLLFFGIMISYIFINYFILELDNNHKSKKYGDSYDFINDNSVPISLILFFILNKKI